MKKENKKIMRKVLILGNNKKLINLVEGGMMKNVEICSSPEKLYKVFKKYIRNKQEVDFEIIGGTNKNPYFFELKGKPASCSMEEIKNLYQMFQYYFVNKWADENL